MLYVFLILILISNISAMIDDKEKKIQAQTEEEERVSQEKLIENVTDMVLRIKTENDEQSWLSLEKILPKRKEGYDIKSLFKALIKILHADSVKSNTKNEELIKKSYKAYLKTMEARESKEKGYTYRPPRPSGKSFEHIVDIESIEERLKSYEDEISIVKNAYKKWYTNTSHLILFQLGNLQSIIRNRQYIDLYIHIIPNKAEDSKLKNLTEFNIVAYDRYKELKTYFIKNINLYETIVAIDTIINDYGIIFEELDNCLSLFISILNNKSMSYDQYKSEYIKFMQNINDLYNKIGIRTFNNDDIKNLSSNNFIKPSAEAMKSVELFLEKHGYSSLDLDKIVKNLQEKEFFEIRKQIKIYLDNIRDAIANGEPSFLERFYQIQKTSKQQLDEKILNAQKDARNTFNKHKDFLELNKSHMENYQRIKYEQLKEEVSKYPSESFIPWNKIVIGSLVTAVVGSVGYGLYKYFQNTKISIIPKLSVPLKI